MTVISLLNHLKTWKLVNIMESLNLTGAPQLFFGIYLIVHGLIHSLFLSYSLNTDTNTYTGWSGKSWILNPFLNSNLIEVIGKIIWAMIIILFVISGLAVLGLQYIKNYIEVLIIISSLIAIIAFLIFFDGLSPTPYNFLIGLTIDFVFLVYTLFYPSEQNVVMIILACLFIVGIIWVFISDVVPLINKSTT